ncbi:PHP domain-containing protein [Acetivibrio cellulolyticus]|uniref:PHP domain-containing protein n=1 Tax=Acetivibrio cellulolyticus TaxID=35830 RepID=UPI0001E30503|nr:PHP domain-containing protein [Acetivibrio cellulolyticus]
MKAFYDLHIHSALSPCAENEMTPNNIVNMAYIKGLDIIAVTDHNVALNCEAVLKCAKHRGILAVPGMELETREEVHLVCLFPGLEEVLKMQNIVNNALPDLENREDIFGQQIIMDEDDNTIGNYKQMLLTAVDLSIDEVFEKVGSLGGIVVPAHIDRDSYSIISNLGIVPDYLDIKYLEFSKDCVANEFISRNSYLSAYKFLKSSDAHNLGNLLEKESSFEVEEISIECLFEFLRK